MISKILMAAAAVLNTVPLIYISSVLLKPRFKLKLNLVLHSLVITLLLGVKVILENTIGFAPVISIINLVLQFFVICFFSQEKFLTKLKVYLILVACISTGEVFCSFVFFLSGNDTTRLHEPIIRLLSSMPMAIFSFMGAFIWQKITTNKMTNRRFAFYFFICFQIISTITLVFYSALNPNTVIRLSSALVFYAIFCILTDVFFVKAASFDHKKMQLEASLKQALENERTQYEYYQSLTESITSLRRFRHDINNLLQTLSLVISDPSSQNEGKQLFDQLKVKFNSLELPHHGQNPVIDAVIFTKSSAIREKGIDFDASLRLEDSTRFESIDLCSIFSNLLDNAADGAAECENAYISLKVWSECGYFFIRCENSYVGKLKKKGKKLLSTKGTSRGLGLSIIENIAVKYDGYFITEAKENFVALAALALN